MKIKKLFSRDKRKRLTFVCITALLFLLSVFIGTKFTQTANPASKDSPKATGYGVLKIYSDDPVRGRADAKVTVVEFADFQCPFSSAYAGFNSEVIKAFQELNKSYRPAGPNINSDYVKSGKVRFVWKDFPFIGEESVWAAQAARCAADQGKFWEYNDFLFSHQQGENKGAFSQDNLKRFALELKLNTDEFNRCLDTGKYEKKIRDSLEFAKNVDVNGTPTTFISGRMIAGAVNYDKFKVLIEEELKK